MKPTEPGSTVFKRLHTGSGLGYTGVCYIQSTYRDPAGIDVVSSLLLLISLQQPDPRVVVGEDVTEAVLHAVGGQFRGTDDLLPPHLLQVLSTTSPVNSRLQAGLVC